MLSNIIAFLIMLNPFAMFLYLQPVMQELKHRDFLLVLFKASLISFAIFATFMFAGDFLFQNIFRIHFESFRIFGGIIIFTIAYLFIVKGHKAFLQVKGNLDDMASEIALPFMVGAGTISLSILLSHTFPLTVAAFGLILILALNFLFIITLKYIRDALGKKRLEIAFDKIMQIMLRINGFLLGAIGIDMVVQGTRAMFC